MFKTPTTLKSRITIWYHFAMYLHLINKFPTIFYCYPVSLGVMQNWQDPIILNSACVSPYNRSLGTREAFPSYRINLFSPFWKAAYKSEGVFCLRRYALQPFQISYSKCNLHTKIMFWLYL